MTTALKGLSRARHQVVSVFDICIEIFAVDRLSFFFLVALLLLGRPLVDGCLEFRIFNLDRETD